jgi:hypothetical protein
MVLPNIALMGRARSGKDTIASRLVERHGYVRVAFADPLKEMALRIDPLIATFPDMPPVQLSRLVADTGWEYAKDRYPEVRRILQNVGQTVREEIPGYWLGVAMSKIARWETAGKPVVVTDCRYLDEALTLDGAGFQTVRVVRPGIAQMAHESETALNTWVPHRIIYNNSMINELWLKADHLVTRA